MNGMRPIWTGGRYGWTPFVAHGRALLSIGVTGAKPTSARDLPSNYARNVPLALKAARHFAMCVARMARCRRAAHVVARLLSM